MAVKPQILIVDDEEDSRAGLETLLGTWGYATEVASQGRDALEKVPHLRPSLVITDLMMPDMDGLALLTALQQEMPRMPVIILTGRATVDTAVGAMRQGAYDYLTKPVDLDRLRLLIEKALDRARTLDEITILRRRVKDVWGMGRLIGRSAPMQEVHRLIEQAAATSAPVLIHGETGTGKELVARTLHELSVRAGGPFVAVNCAAMPETLRRASSSATSGGPSPTRATGARAASSWPMAARSCSTRWPRCSRAPRPSSSACSKRARSDGSGARARSRWTCGWWPPPTRT
jgi:DNA-binding NtrC family response regulator